MPETHRNSRMIAEERNTKAGFESSEGFDAIAGCPAGVAPQGEQRNYAADPKNPAEKSAPCKNVR
jgi:hypothetical protein